MDVRRITMKMFRIMLITSLAGLSALSMEVSADPCDDTYNQCMHTGQVGGGGPKYFAGCSYRRGICKAKNVFVVLPVLARTAQSTVSNATTMPMINACNGRIVVGVGRNEFDATSAMTAANEDAALACKSLGESCSAGYFIPTQPVSRASLDDGSSFYRASISAVCKS
jgi:hypothetical protein